MISKTSQNAPARLSFSCIWIANVSPPTKGRDVKCQNAGSRVNLTTKHGVDAPRKPWIKKPAYGWQQRVKQCQFIRRRQQKAPANTRARQIWILLFFYFFTGNQSTGHFITVCVATVRANNWLFILSSWIASTVLPINKLFIATFITTSCIAHCITPSVSKEINT